MNGQPNIHLVSRDLLNRPKKEGGIGVRRAREMNMALLTRMG